MNEFYNNHYIRLDEHNNITHGFSDAFEQPQAGDILITEQGGRHFELLGEINPPLTDMQGAFVYKYENSEVIANPVREHENK